MYAWDMKGSKPSFVPKMKELNGLELPKGTVLEVEFVHELQGEVRITSLVAIVTSLLVKDGLLIVSTRCINYTTAQNTTNIQYSKAIENYKAMALTTF